MSQEQCTIDSFCGRVPLLFIIMPIYRSARKLPTASPPGRGLQGESSCSASKRIHSVSRLPSRTKRAKRTKENDAVMKGKSTVNKGSDVKMNIRRDLQNFCFCKAHQSIGQHGCLLATPSWSKHVPGGVLLAAGIPRDILQHMIEEVTSEDFLRRMDHQVPQTSISTCTEWICPYNMYGGKHAFIEARLAGVVGGNTAHECFQNCGVFTYYP